jgi:threonine dehydratase
MADLTPSLAADRSKGPPGLVEVLEARRVVSRHLSRTSLYAYPGLSALVGAEVWVKHENHQPIGAFKVRGGINLLSQLSVDEKAAGVVTASTGNHGLSIAWAARAFGVRATICVPEGANPAKVDAILGVGAEVVTYGADFDEAREHAEKLAAESGSRYLHPGNEPALIAGVATETLEILEDQPSIDAIVVPVGGGSGAAGACIVAKAIRPSIQVIAVQSSAAPAAYRSWCARALVEDEMATFAEGLATRTAFELPQRVLWELLDDFVLVGDEELRVAVRAMIEHTRNLVEPAGAAPLAAAMRLGDRLSGRRIALICTGGNISSAQLRAILDH